MGRDLTQGQRRALTILSQHPAQVVPPGRTIERLQISYIVGTHLVADGYARTDPDLGLLVITQAGRGALAAPVKDTPRLLAPAARPARTEHGYTHIPGLQMRDDPGEAITELEQKQQTNARHAAGLAGCHDEYIAIRRRIALDIERLEQLPDTRLHGQVRQLKHRLAAMDRQLKAA